MRRGNLREVRGTFALCYFINSIADFLQRRLASNISRLFVCNRVYHAQSVKVLH